MLVDAARKCKLAEKIGPLQSSSPNFARRTSSGRVQQWRQRAMQGGADRAQTLGFGAADAAISPDRRGQCRDDELAPRRCSWRSRANRARTRSRSRRMRLSRTFHRSRTAVCVTHVAKRRRGPQHEICRAANRANRQSEQPAHAARLASRSILGARRNSSVRNRQARAAHRITRREGSRHFVEAIDPARRNQLNATFGTPRLASDSILSGSAGSNAFATIEPGNISRLLL